MSVVVASPGSVRLATLLDSEPASSGGVQAGGESSDSGVDLLARACRRLRADGVAGERIVVAFRVPGRIEVLGKHTDYAGGRSLLAAVDRGIHLVAAPRTDDVVTIADAPSGERARFRVAPGLAPAEGWARYPMAVARRVARNFPGPLRGADIAFASDLPAAAGLSSSSALVTAVFLAMAAANDLAAAEAYGRNILGPEELADYLGAVENGWGYRGLAGDLGVGTLGGSQDHTAILCARADALVQYAFAPVRFERALPLPAGHRFAVAVSGIPAEKSGAVREHYNELAGHMRRAAELWRAGTGRQDPVIGQALAMAPDAVDRLRGILGQARKRGDASTALLARVEQFIEESLEIVPACAAALERGDLAAFGALVDRSHELARARLRNQLPETVHLARAARELGAVAASPFGAGFGGSVWALAESAHAGEFLRRWRADYLRRFPMRADGALFFATDAGPPALRLA